MRKAWKSSTLVVALSQVGGTLQAQVPTTPEQIQALLRDVIRNHRKQASQFTEYTADRTVTCRDVDWKGTPVYETSVSEHYQSWNRNLDVILSRNGKPRSESQIQRDREEAARFMEVDMKEKPQSLEAEGPEYASHKGAFSMSIYRIYRNAIFSNPRMEMLDGRPTIVKDFAPGKTATSADIAPVNRLSGSVWIDAADRITAKLTARVAPAFAESAKPPINPARKNEPVYVQVFTRLKDGVWLGSYTRLNPSTYPKYFSDETYDWVVESGNYRRFGAEPAVLKPMDRKTRIQS